MIDEEISDGKLELVYQNEIMNSNYRWLNYGEDGADGRTLRLIGQTDRRPRTYTPIPSEAADRYIKMLKEDAEADCGTIERLKSALIAAGIPAAIVDIIANET